MWWLLGLFKGRSFSTYIIIALCIALSLGGVYVKYLHNSKVSLENKNAVLESVVEDNNKQIKMLNEDRIKLDEIITRNLKDREDNKIRLEQYQTELGKLIHESEDKCLSMPIDNAILNRLQHKDSKEH